MKRNIIRNRTLLATVALVFALFSTNYALADDGESAGVTQGSIKVVSNVEYPMLSLDGNTADAEFEGANGKIAIIFNVDRTVAHTLIVNGGDDFETLTVKIKKRDFKIIRIRTSKRSRIYRWRATKRVILKKAKKKTGNKKAPKKPEYDPDDED